MSNPACSAADAVGHATTFPLPRHAHVVLALPFAIGDAYAGGCLKKRSLCVKVVSQQGQT